MFLYKYDISYSINEFFNNIYASMCHIYIHIVKSRPCHHKNTNIIIYNNKTEKVRR